MIVIRENDEWISSVYELTLQSTLKAFEEKLIRKQKKFRQRFSSYKLSKLLKDISSDKWIILSFTAHRINHSHMSWLTSQRRPTHHSTMSF